MGKLLAVSEVWRALGWLFAFVGLEPDITVVVIVSALLLLFRQVITYIRLVYQSALTYLIANRVRQKLFDRFLNARLSHQEQFSSGPFTNAMTTETVMASQSVLMPIEFLNAAGMMCGYMLILLWISPLATIGVLLVLCVVAFGLRRITRRVRILGQEIVQANGDYAQHFIQRCRSARLIRLSQSETQERYTAAALLHRQERRNVQAAKFISLTETGIEPIALIAGIPILVLTVTVYGAELSAVGMFLLVMARLAPMVKQVARSWQAYLKVRASAENVLELLNDLDDAREQHEGSVDLPDPVTSIRFKDVIFRYDAVRDNALNGINCTIPGGRMTAVVGPSGSGKSTLIDLIPALRAASGGRVLINDVPLQDIRLDSLRSSCAFVSQRPALMTGTIAEQIKYGNADITDADIRRAASLANAADFIEALPRGYETDIGEEGAGLSGGQKQRIELARALAAEAPILILDEPTSSVDGESAHQIALALHEIRRQTNTTIVLVGHHLGMLSECDQIIILEDGRVRAQGQHGTLVREPGWYQETFNRQTNNGIRAAAVAT
jgi:ABC-type multidrug transport system fused ATPase/permease subunit